MPIPAGRSRFAAGRVGPVAVLSLIVTVLAGCSSTTPAKKAAEPAVSSPPVVLSSANLRLPLDSYLPTDQQVRQVDQGRLGLIDQCMQRFGFRYQLKLPTLADSSVGPNYRRYGLTDTKSAAVDGYSLPAGDPSKQPRPANPVLGPEEKTALFGEGESTVKGIPVPQGGCLSEANRRLDGDGSDGDLNAVQQLSFNSFKLSQQDSRVKAVFAQWSACMAESGYHYSAPLAPLSDPKLANKAGPDAVRVALADIACKQRTNLVGTWFAVESAYQNRLIGSNSPVVAGAKKLLAGRLTIAAGLGSSAG